MSPLSLSRLVPGILSIVVAIKPVASQPTTADARLRALYTAEWQWRQQEMARVSDAPGDAGAADHHPRVDAASQARRYAYWQRTLAALDSIPLDQLSPEERINAQVFGTSLRALANDVKFKTYETPLNSDTFFWTEFTPRQGFATIDVYRNYIGRLRDVPRYFDENMVNMRAGIARGFTIPRVSVMGRERTIEPYLAADSTNPLYTPFTQMPATISAAEQEALRREARTVIREVIAPAYTKLQSFMRDEYIPRTRTTLAATAMPDGQAY